MFISAASRRNDSPSFEEIDILWITAGLGCDGDTIAVTAATQPTIEEILLEAFPGIPKINFYSPFLSYENGADFLRPFHFAAENQQASFVTSASFFLSAVRASSASVSAARCRDSPTSSCGL